MKSLIRVYASPMNVFTESRHGVKEIGGWQRSCKRSGNDGAAQSDARSWPRDWENVIETINPDKLVIKVSRSIPRGPSWNELITSKLRDRLYVTTPRRFSRKSKRDRARRFNLSIRCKFGWQFRDFQLWFSIFFFFLHTLRLSRSFVCSSLFHVSA